MAPTPNKGRKSVSSWETCSRCEAMFQTKDTEPHNNICKTDYSNWDWKHNFIKNNILYGILETADIPSDRTESEAMGMVFISVEVMQICGISLGSPVMLKFKNSCVVKLAWPSNNKSVTSVSLLRTAIELDQLEGPLKLEPLSGPLYIADEVSLKYRGKNSLPPPNETTQFLKFCNEHKIFAPKNRIQIRYYGRPYNFQITEVHSKDKPKDLSGQLEQLSLSGDSQFYKFLFSTTYKIQTQKPSESSKPFRHTLADIGGYDDLIEELKSSLDGRLDKGILLHGPPGVGKSMIAEALLNDRNENLAIIKFSSLYTKFFDDAEALLRRKFDSVQGAPGIIYFEDLDTLFRKENQNEHKSKLLLVLVNLLDEIRELPVTVLASTSRLEDVDALLRKPGRLDTTFEVAVPGPETRFKILEKILLKIDHSLSADQVEHLAFISHGYVGADLDALCTKAVSRKRGNVGLEEFVGALRIVKPSAMLDVHVEVAEVKWEDIGGQEKVKLKLKQALEWPYKRPEAFKRFRIQPPRGILLYGPPGCSKTMIAKACATESKMNFLLVRASELFSKWVGESEKAVKETFRKARQVAPSIIFLDEIEAIGRGRGSNSEGSNVDEKVLSLILTEMDGVTALGNVTVIGATNRPDKMDKALLRPGRFDRIIYVPLPDAETREAIFKIKMKDVPLENVSLKDLVDRTEGYSGAEVQLVYTEAALHALENNEDADKVTLENFNAALSIVKPRISESDVKLYESFKF